MAVPSPFRRRHACVRSARPAAGGEAAAQHRPRRPGDPETRLARGQAPATRNGGAGTATAAEASCTHSVQMYVVFCFVTYYYDKKYVLI